MPRSPTILFKIIYTANKKKKTNIIAGDLNLNPKKIWWINGKPEYGGAAKPLSRQLHQQDARWNTINAILNFWKPAFYPIKECINWSSHWSYVKNIGDKK
jgi:hypothetical protein